MDEKTLAEIAQLEGWRKALKENGLEHAVRLMSVEERGLFRRAAREAFQTAINMKLREAQGAVQQPASYEKREAFDPNKADGYAQKDGKTVLVRPNRGDQSGWQP